MTLPPIGLDAVGAGLALARGAWLATLLSAAGALAFRAREPTPTPALASRTMRLILASLAGALLAWLAWVAAQAAVLAAPPTGGHGAGALLQALGGTAFGRLAAAQLGLLGAAALTLGLARWLPAGLALAAVALQAGHLHGWAMDDGVGALPLSGALHLLAAALWLGGLAPLRLVVRGSAPALAAAAARRFSRLALPCVIALALTAFWQGRALLGGWAGLVGSAYGWVAALKLALFIALLGYAARHRLRLTPALARPEPGAAHRALAQGIARETAVGLLVVLAAALLSGLQPGMHLQPVWPFPLRPSLVSVREDAELAREATGGACGLIVALGLALLAALHRPARWPRLRWPWLRWPTLAGAAALAWFAAPHLRPLLVEAHATSFYRSPTGFAATGIVEGEGLHAGLCAGCHGAAGAGDGPQAARLPVPPADLTAPHLWEHADGELFWWLSQGMQAPDGAPAMPGFADRLSDLQRWQVIDFIRARNAGVMHAATARWPRPLAAPDFAADCAGGASVSLSEMRGRLVRLAFQSAPGAAPTPTPPGAAARTIFVPLPDAADASGGDCIAGDPAVPAAYAIVTGLPPSQLAGANVLVDADGVLREVLRPGPPEALQAALRRVAIPLPDESAAEPLHRH